MERRTEVAPLLHFDSNYDDKSFYGNNNYNNLHNVEEDAEGEDEMEVGDDLDNILANEETTEEEEEEEDLETLKDVPDQVGDGGIVAYHNGGHLMHKLLRNHRPRLPEAMDGIAEHSTTTTTSATTGNEGLNAGAKVSTPSAPVTDCTVDRLAIYKVVLHTYWTRELFPKHYPDWKPTAQWSKTIGKIHHQILFSS